MKFSLKPLCAALLGSFLVAAAPAAQAQVSVNVNVGRPAWGPAVPAEAQYYYIPEIDGYYDLYSQQYIVFQDGYWVPLPELYGYDPYQFHPVVIAYRGREPWVQRDYYHRYYAYQPYRPYYGGRNGYGAGYSSAYGRNGYDARSGTAYGRGGYARPDYDHDNRGRYNDNRGYENRDREHNNRGYEARNQYPGNQGGVYGRNDYPRGNQGSPQAGPYQQGGRAYDQGARSPDPPGWQPARRRPPRRRPAWALKPAF